MRLVADTTPAVQDALNHHEVRYRSPDILDNSMHSAVGQVRERLVEIIGELGGAA